MKLKSLLIGLGVAAVATGVAISAQDRYTVKVPGGLAFADFRGYETWQVIYAYDHRKVILPVGFPATKPVPLPRGLPPTPPVP